MGASYDKGHSEGAAKAKRNAAKDLAKALKITVPKGKKPNKTFELVVKEAKKLRKKLNKKKKK